MKKVHPLHFIEELQFDIETDDIIKARLVMAHFAEMDERTQRAALDEMNRAPGGFVITLLAGVLAVSAEGGKHLPMLKELLYSKALDNPDLLVRILMQETKPAHRVVLAEIAGEIKLESATPVLLAILSKEKDEKALRGVMLALGSIGDSSAVNPVSEFLYSAGSELVIAAIESLGLLGTPTAIQRLFEKLGGDQNLDNMILDVFAGSQETKALECLNALLSAKFAYLRSAAKQRLIRIGNKAVPVLINNLLYDDPDLLIHTLNVLGGIGDASAIAPIRKLLHNEPADANVRFAAYEALGFLPIAQGAFILAQGLEDEVENVRAAAARAIDHNYNTVLAAGLKNLIRDEDAGLRPISRVIIDAECDTIFSDLIEDDIFRDFALSYLHREAHPEIRDHFADLLKERGQETVAAAEETSAEARRTLKVYAVDDSRMVLNIYRSALHRLGCDPVLFEFPADAVRQVASDKPDLIFTDLNMPDINGVELARAVRRHFTSEQLPIIMVTTQSEGRDSETAVQAGINAILRKPFTEETLRSAMQDVLREHELS
jgi:CheY-like chemotaxis protein